jgi:hypothetical protein
LTLRGKLLDLLKMLRKIFSCFALFFFILSWSATVEQFSPLQAAESRASLAVADGALAPATSLAMGLNRLARAKSLAKAWISHHGITPTVGFTCSTIAMLLTRPFSKYDVYQQMNVYRL